MAVEWGWGHFNTIAKRLREERQLLETNIKLAKQTTTPNVEALSLLQAQLHAVDNITYRFADYFLDKCENFNANTFLTRSGFPREGENGS